MTNIDLIAKALEYRPEAWKGENRDIARHINDAGIIAFPRRIGDVVYYLNGYKHNYITSHEIVGFIIDKDGVRLDLDCFTPYLNSKYLFLYRSDAEKALKERMQNE
ncbi:MAG: hypothetical protein IIW48_10150 [Clostridia bacterium]|nr:hypothetical protein [Clostridia bacterium]